MSCIGALVTLALWAGTADATGPLALTQWRPLPDAAPVQWECADLDVDTDRLGLLELTLRLEQPGGTGRLSWHGAGESHHDARSLPFPLDPHRDQQTHHLNLFQPHAPWSGRVTNLRLSVATMAGGTVEIVSATLSGVKHLSPDDLNRFQPLEILPALRTFRPGSRVPIRYRIDPRLFSAGVPATVELFTERVRDAGFPRAVLTWAQSGAELTSATGLELAPGSGIQRPGHYHAAARIESGPLAGLEGRADYRVTPDTALLYFAAPWTYLRDFSLVKAGDRWHLLAGVGRAGRVQAREHQGNEEAFLHASCTALRGWQRHDDVLPIEVGETGKVTTPHVLRHGETWVMTYTALDHQGAPSIRQATSADLLHWPRDADRAVWTATDGGDARRDPMLLVDGEQFVLYYVTGPASREVVAAATSSDLRHWHEIGPVLTPSGVPASPFVLERQGRYTLVVGGDGRGVYQSESPLGPFEPVPDRLPPHLAGLRVVRDGELEILAGYTRTPMGNQIEFHRLVWDEDGLPNHAPLTAEDL